MRALSNIGNAIEKFECTTGIKARYIYMNGVTMLKLQDEFDYLLVAKRKHTHCEVFGCIVVIDDRLKGDECYLSAKRIK